MDVIECGFPKASMLDHAVINAAYFKDSYSAPLHHSDISITNLFFALFGHQPIWMKRVLVMRNHIASWCGLDVPTPAEIMNVEIKSSYNVGDKIGPWPIFALSDNELIAGRDNGHLDFRLSVLRITVGGAPQVVVSTICLVHNLFGKLYLFFIVPFHKWGVRRLIADAVVSGRL
jgi:Protein of unknown function (DUF2867)